MCLSPAGQGAGWETNSFYQIEKLICEAKPMLPAAPRHRKAREPVMLDGGLAGKASPPGPEARAPLLSSPCLERPSQGAIQACSLRSERC